jgi:hypothetical protein
MVMVAHQAIRMDYRAVLFTHFSETIQEKQPIVVRDEDRLSSVSS